MLVNRYLLGAVLILALALSIAINDSVRVRQDRARLKNNQTALMQKVDFYRTQDSLSAASVQRLELTTSELKENRQELIKTIEDLRIKTRRVKTISTTAINTRDQVRIPMINPVAFQQLEPVDILKVDCQTDWMTIQGQIIGGDFYGTILTTDTIVQVVHRVPHRILFVKYGTKGIRQDITSKNPNASISYTEYIEIKK